MENSRIEQIKQFLKDTPDDAFLNYALAIELVSINDVKSAKELFQFLLQKHPDYSATYFHYGKLILKEGHKDKAKEIFDEGLKVAITNKELHAAAELRSVLNELLYDED